MSDDFDPRYSMHPPGCLGATIVLGLLVVLFVISVISAFVLGLT